MADALDSKCSFRFARISLPRRIWGSANNLGLALSGIAGQSLWYLVVGLVRRCARDAALMAFSNRGQS